MPEDANESAEKEQPKMPEQMVVKKGINYKFVSIILAIIIVILVGAFLFMTIPTGQTPEPAGTASGQTVAAAGDSVEVIYTGSFLNGTVFDTNDRITAAENNINKQSFQSLKFSIGQNMVIKGFDDAVVGMAVGSKKRVTIQPADGYGEYDPARIQTVPLVDEINKTSEINATVEIPVTFFKNTFGKDPVKDDVVVEPSAGVRYTVLELNNATVMLKGGFEVGQRLNASPYWESTVIKIEGDMVTIEQNPEEGQIIEDQFGTASVSFRNDKIVLTRSPEIGRMIQTPFGPLKVREITADEIILDANHPLAGKVLVFDIEITNITKGSQ